MLVPSSDPNLHNPWSCKPCSSVKVCAWESTLAITLLFPLSPSPLSLSLSLEYSEQTHMLFIHRRPIGMATTLCLPAWDTGLRRVSSLPFLLKLKHSYLEAFRSLSWARLAPQPTIFHFVRMPPVNRELLWWNGNRGWNEWFCETRIYFVCWFSCCLGHRPTELLLKC